MAGFFVIFDAAPAESSDATLGTAPIASTKILAPLKTAKVAYVEAATGEAARIAVEVAYTPQVGLAQSPIGEAGVFTGNKPANVAKASWKED